MAGGDANATRLKPAKLALLCELMPDETTASFVSRLAARNGVGSAAVFCKHFGTTFRKVCEGDPRAKGIIAAISGLDPGVLSNMAVRPLDRLFVHNGQVLRKEGLSRRDVRYCPSCLDDDLEQSVRADLVPQYGRSQWLFVILARCPHHSEPLRTIFNPRSEHIEDFTWHLRNRTPSTRLP